MATNTEIGIGIRRLIYSLAVPEYRNFEPTGQQYIVVTVAYEYLGTDYNSGDLIPFDVDGTSYSNVAQLERDFNSGLIDPAS